MSHGAGNGLPRPEPAPAEIESLVAECIGHSDRGRGDLIARLCAEHPAQAAELRQRLLELERMGMLPPLPPADPERIGPYRIVRRLGQGGMGTVYLADCREPVARTVALKVIRHGADSARVLARFDLERRTLALMQHPHVARIHDAGATADGRPWFAMEYLPGLLIDRHCNERRLSVDQRLQLFLQGCAGVQHAHAKGVVHRDLTPNNILVVDQGGAPAVKIIDFGLARAIAGDEIDTGVTAPGQFLGTPGYASPEQTGGSPHDIDARTDVWSLGMVLCQLLVDRVPFLLPGQDRVHLHELRQRICEQDPATPSDLLTGSADAAAIAAGRATEAAALARAVRGDLDWIVLRCIEKDPAARYQTVAQLADDLERHRRHEPIVARPHTLVYRLRKFVRRNRLGVAAALAVLVTIAAGVVATRAQYVQAESARREAQGHLDRFRLVSAVVQLREARQATTRLGPASPASLPELQAWQRDHEQPLVHGTEALQLALGQLRLWARPQTAAEREVELRSHPRHAEWLERQAALGAVRAAAIVRGGGPLTLPDLPATVATATAAELNQQAARIVDPRQRVFGEEPLAVALARLAVAKAQQGDTTVSGHAVLLTLARASHAAGLDDEALRHLAASATQAGDAAAEASCESLRESIEGWRGAGASQRLATMVDQAAALEREVSARREWTFADPTERFLHDTLVQLLADLERFGAEGGERQQVAVRVRWAQRLSALPARHPLAAVSWEQARSALAAADGVVASTLYRQVPIDLHPQAGLVPIGKNPVTGLWEFHDLRSAWDPVTDPDPATLPSPTHDAEGNVAITAAAGIVFVLLPGGRFTMGCQRRDPDAPQYDPFDEEEEGMTTVTLAPFLLARHELTQAQWARLSPTAGKPRWPSGYEVGGKFVGIGVVDGTHPVETVNWGQAEAVLRLNGLTLPTEAQWEYGCRGGTTTPWFCGDEPDAVEGFGNVLDQTAVSLYPGWRQPHTAAFADGFAGPSPVGRFAANPFGLHDAIGNVWEWCLDPMAQLSSPAAVDTGLRSAGQRYAGDGRIARGGCYVTEPQGGRSGNRNHYPVSFQDLKVGLRAARRLER